MRHASGADHHHVHVGVERFHCFANRLAELEAALSSRGRILDDVYADWNNLEGPRVDVAADQGEWHGQSMINGHIVCNRHVEFVEDERLSDMPRQFRMS